MSLGTAGKPTSARLRSEYVDAVVAAGGVPVALPHVESKGLARAQLEAVGGVLLIGGPDYDPARYGERPRPGAVLVNPRRERYEIMLVRAAERLGMPLLGICGGHQLVNIVRGGTIVQDLASSGLYPGLVHHRVVLNSPSKPNGISHPDSEEAGSRLAKVMGKLRFRTNSSHHQAVARPGRNLRAVAWCADGVCEAIEDPRPERFVLGIQWHPERMFRKAKLHLRPFRGLVLAARD